MGEKLNDLNIVEATWGNISPDAEWNTNVLSPVSELHYSDLVVPRYVARIFYDDIKDVIFNQPATIILWKDGTKTVVKVKDDEVYDEEKGLAMAICKKVLGKDYHKVFRAYTPDDCGSITDWYDLGYEMGYKLGTLKKVFNGLKDGIDEVISD